MSQVHLAVPYHVRRQAADALAAEISTAFSTYTDVRPQRDVPLPDSELVVDLLYTFPLGWRVAHVLLAAPVTNLALQRWTLAAARSGIDLTFWLWDGARLDDAATWIADRAGVVYFLRQKAAGAFVPLLARRRGAPSDPAQGRDPIVHVSARFLRTAIVRYFELWGPLDGLRMQRALDGGMALRRAVDELLAEVGATTHATTRWGGISGAIEQASDGTWVAERLPQVYPEVPRLLPMGMLTCKTVAHSYGQPSPDTSVTWLPLPAVEYGGALYHSRLVAQWRIFFDELMVDATYAPVIDDLDDADLLPDFWLPTLGSQLIVRRLQPALEELNASQRLALRANHPVILLYGQPGMSARGMLFQPSPPGGPVTAEPAPFQWSACAHCDSLLARAQFSPGLSLILCSNPRCPSRVSDAPPAAAGRTQRQIDASHIAQQATFKPWRDEERAASA